MKFDDFPEKLEISRNWLTHIAVTQDQKYFRPCLPQLILIAGNRLHCLRVADRTINIPTGANRFQ